MIPIADRLWILFRWSIWLWNHMTINNMDVNNHMRAHKHSILRVVTTQVVWIIVNLYRLLVNYRSKLKVNLLIVSNFLCMLWIIEKKLISLHYALRVCTLRCHLLAITEVYWREVVQVLGSSDRLLNNIGYRHFTLAKKSNKCLAKISQESLVCH